MEGRVVVWMKPKNAKCKMKKKSNVGRKIIFEHRHASLVTHLELAYNGFVLPGVRVHGCVAWGKKLSK